ncbi:MAG: beta-L-arabinofuranosidase domain-containing protein [Flavitalea sp.]
MNRSLFRSILLLIFFVGISTSSWAQNGDQVLDGIGETGMIARYVFNGNVKDWSRNNLHAKSGGSALEYVNDERFGKVLSLAGNSSSFVILPSDVLSNTESISISGWIFLRSNQPGQVFFDFGKDSTSHFFAAPSGIIYPNGFQAMLTVKQNAPSIPINKWVHISIVFDVTSKKIISYVDGKTVSESGIILSELNTILSQDLQFKNLFYIGKSLSLRHPNLNALLHDFRIYRVPLNKNQIAGIFNNAGRNGSQNSVNTTSKKQDSLQQFTRSESQLYHAYLIKVPDVPVETNVGNLPRLPTHVPGIYRNGWKGSGVRVIWPADTNNVAVLKPGRYSVTGRGAGTDFRPKAFVTVKNASQPSSPTLKLEPFSLNQVTLQKDVLGRNTKFIENRDKFLNTLANTDPNSFLFMFRHAFGQKQPDGAKPLGVWDSRDTKLRGHATGHYLSAIAQAYAGTGHNKTLQENFSRKMEYMVNALYELSQMSGMPKDPGGSFISDPALIPFGPGKSSYNSDLSDEGIRTDYWNWGKGFISAYPPDQFIMLERGAKYGGQVQQIWAPFYTLHKIMAGLLDVYEMSENKKALEIAEGMGDWVYARLSRLPTDTLIKMWNTYIAGEYGGMNEVMARLYRITGKPDHLKTAKLFDNIRVFFGDAKHAHGLAKNVDLFRGLHANQHIPQVVGSIETYRVSKNPEYYKVADNFWYKVVHDYSYSIGGVAGSRNPANAECFISQPGTIYENGFSADGQNETCGTYNMLKLTSSLFLYDQRADLMDYYERGLYNHILASVDENSSANTYHVPLNPGAVKQFGNPDMTGFTCCNGTAIESSTKLQNSIYFKSRDNNALYVNLYVPSTLKWNERNIRVEQKTNFPKEDQTQLIIYGSGKFDLHVRVPGWATKGYFVKINGEAQKHQAMPGSYLKLSRTWKDGDVIELKMPFQFHLQPVMDQQNIASLFYGPVLLAAQESERRKEWRKITLDPKDLGKSIKGDPGQLQFTIDDVIFKPFYETYGRHSVYLDVRLK